MSGANGTNAITATGVRISVTNTNATSGTNIGLDVTASGATTSNLSINAVGNALFTANELKIKAASGVSNMKVEYSGGTTIYQEHKIDGSANSIINSQGADLIFQRSATNVMNMSVNTLTLLTGISLNVDNGTFRVDQATDRVSVLTATPTHALTVNGQARLNVVATGSAADSIATFDNGVFEMVAPGDFTGLPYVALTGTSTATGNLTLNGNDLNLNIHTGGQAYVRLVPNVVSIGDPDGNNNSTLLTVDDAAEVITLKADANTLITGPVQMSNFGAGAATFDASGNISSVSDPRLKYIMGTYNAGLNELMKINPILYKWRPESGMETIHKYAGFDASEIYDVLGESGSGVNNKGYRSVQDRALIAMLINAVKEQQSQIEILKSKIK